MKKPEKTHFGFETVGFHEKASRVAAVFHSVADNYDVMNDLMSLGIHRFWKARAIALAQVMPGQWVLDVAGGTGDLAKAFVKQVGATGRVVLTDINAAMLNKGREKLINAGVVQSLNYVQADAQQLAFADNSFDCVTIAFGLRNVTDKDAALRDIFRVLKPSGKLIILEFSQPHASLKPIYDAYSFKVLPWLGKLVAGDSDSYRYLAESIRMHPDQITLKNMLEATGFISCDYINLTGGVVAIHRGYKA